MTVKTHAPIRGLHGPDFLGLGQAWPEREIEISAQARPSLKEKLKFRPEAAQPIFFQFRIHSLGFK